MKFLTNSETPCRSPLQNPAMAFRPVNAYRKPTVILIIVPEDADDVYCTLEKLTKSIEATTEIQEWRRRKAGQKF
jgi:hypothetical protein